MSVENTSIALVPIPIDLTKDADYLCQSAREIVISDDESYDFADELLKQVVRRRSRLADLLKPNISRLHGAHKAACEQFNDEDGPWREAEDVLKAGLGDHNERREIARRAAEVKLQEDADLAEAEEAEREGDTERAEAVLNGGGTTAVSLAPTAKRGGASFRDIWRADVRSVRQAAEAWLKGEIPDGVICVDMKVANTGARMLRGKLNWPGIRAVKTTSVATGRR